MSFLRQSTGVLRRSMLANTRQASTSSSAAAAGTKHQPRSMMQIWYEPAAIPIYVTVAAACLGAGWYLTHLARHPDVIWDRHNNPEPWNNVEQGTNTKLYAVNQQFDRQYKRDRF